MVKKLKDFTAKELDDLATECSDKCVTFKLDYNENTGFVLTLATDSPCGILHYSYSMNSEVDKEKVFAFHKKLDTNSIEKKFLQSEFGLIKSDDKLKWKYYDHEKEIIYFQLFRGTDYKVSFNCSKDLLEIKGLLARMSEDTNYYLNELFNI